MPCSSQIDACSTFMSCETNLLKKNNELKSEVKNLSNKLARCYNSKVIFEHMLKTQRNYGDKCGLGFKKKMTKEEKKERNEQHRTVADAPEARNSCAFKESISSYLFST